MRKNKNRKIHIDGDDTLQQDLYPQSDQNAPQTGQDAEIDLPDDYVVLDPASATALVNKYVSNRRQAKRLADEDSEDFGSRASRLIRLEDFQNGDYEQYLQVDPKSYFVDDDGEEYVIGVSPYTSSRKVGYSGFTSSKKQKDKLDKRMQEIYDRRFLRDNQQIVSNTLGKIHKRDLLDRIQRGGDDAVKAMQEIVAEGNDEFAHDALNVAAFFPGLSGAAARGIVGLSGLANDIRAGRMPSGEFNPKNIRWGSAVLDTALGLSGLGELGSYINPVRLMRYGVDYGYDPYRTYTAKEFRDILSREAEAARSNAKLFAKLDKEALNKSGGKPVPAKASVPLGKFPKTSEQIVKNQNIDWASRAGYRTYKDILNAYAKTSPLHKDFVDFFTQDLYIPRNYREFIDKFKAKSNDPIISDIGGDFAASVLPKGLKLRILPNSPIHKSKLTVPESFAVSSSALADSMRPVGTAARHAAKAVSHPVRSAKKAVRWTTKKFTPVKRINSLQEKITQYASDIQAGTEKLNNQMSTLRRYFDKIIRKPQGHTALFHNFEDFDIAETDVFSNVNRISFNLSKGSYVNLLNFLEKHFPHTSFPFHSGANGSITASINDHHLTPKPPFKNVHEIDVPVFGSHTSTGAPVSRHLNFSFVDNTQLSYDLSTSEGAKAFYKMYSSSVRPSPGSVKPSPGNFTLTFDPESNMVKAHNIAYIERVTGGKVMGTPVFKNVPFNDFDVFITENIIRSKFPKAVADELINKFREKMNSKSGFTKIEYQLDRGPNGKSIYGKYGEIDMNCIMSDPKTGKATGKLAYEFWRMADPQGYSDAFIKEMVEHPSSMALPPIPYTPDELLAMTDPVTKSFIDSVDAEFIPELLDENEQDKVKFAVRSYGYIAYGNPEEVSRGIKGTYRYFIGNEYQMAPRFPFDNPAENLELLAMYGFPYDISNNPAAMQNFFDLVVLDSSIFYRGLDDISDLELSFKNERLAEINRRYYNRYSGGRNGTANGQGINTVLGMATSDGSREQRFYAINGQIPFNSSLTGARTPTEFVNQLRRSFGFTPFTKADYDFVMSLPESERTVIDENGKKYDLSNLFTPGSMPGNIRLQTSLFKNNPDNWDTVSNILKKLGVYFSPGDRYSFSAANNNGPIYASMVSGIPGPKLYTSARSSRSLIQRTKYAFDYNNSTDPHRNISFNADNSLMLSYPKYNYADNPFKPAYEMIIRQRDKLNELIRKNNESVKKYNSLHNKLDHAKDGLSHNKKNIAPFAIPAVLSAIPIVIVASDPFYSKSRFSHLIQKNNLSFNDCMDLILNHDKYYFKFYNIDPTDFKNIDDFADYEPIRRLLITLITNPTE